MVQVQLAIFAVVGSASPSATEWQLLQIEVHSFISTWSYFFLGRAPLSDGMDRRLRRLALLLAPYLGNSENHCSRLIASLLSKLAGLIAVFVTTISFVYACGQTQGAGIVFSRFLEVI